MGNTPFLARLTFQVLDKILKSEQLRVDHEIETFRFVFKWLLAKENAGEEVDGDHVRELILKACRFNQLGHSNTDMENVKNNPILTDKYPGLIPKLSLVTLPRRETRMYPCVIGRYSADGPAFNSSPLHLLVFDLEGQVFPYRRLPEECQRLAGFRVVTNGPYLYLIGGENKIGSGRWNKKVLKFDTILDQWSTEVDHGSEVRHAGTCLDTKRNQIHLVGGFERYRLFRVNSTIVDLGSKSMLTGPELPVNCMDSPACCLGDYVYMFTSLGIYRLRMGDHANRSWEKVEGWLVPSQRFVQALPVEPDAIYLSALGSRDLFRFEPNALRPEPAQCVKPIASFLHTIQNMCLIGKTIYSFVKDQVSENWLYGLPAEEPSSPNKDCILEELDLMTSQTKIVRHKQSRNCFIDPVSSYGCFPIWINDLKEQLKKL